MMVMRMNGNKLLEGRALGIAVAITALVLLMAGGAMAQPDMSIIGIPFQSHVNLTVSLSDSTWFINDNATGGDCSMIGIWDVATRTCTLTANLNKGIQIDGDDITLNGNGHTITGNNTGNGVYLLGRNNINVMSLNINNFSYGILLGYSSNNTLIDNNASKNGYGIFLDYSSNNTLGSNIANSNKYDGISLGYSNNNTLSNNNASNNNLAGIILYSSSNNTLMGSVMIANSYNFDLFGWEDSEFNNQIDSSNTVDGKPIYYVKNAENTFYDSSINAGTFYCVGCLNVTVEDLKLDKNYAGLFFWNTTFSKIHNVSAMDNYAGIYLDSSSNNMLSNNNLSNNDAGIDLDSSSNNTLSGNNASNNDIGIFLDSSGKYPGIDLNSSSKNTGFDMDSSLNNLIYNNIFNNERNSLVYGGTPANLWNITKTPGTNIIGGPYLGGNFWANPNGTGFSQTCGDYNYDGICDSSFTLDSNNIDYLPLTLISVATPTLPTPTPTPTFSPTPTPSGNIAVEIINPTSNSSFLQGEMILISGNASGGTAPYNYSWTSSIDGFIGNSSRIFTFSLSPGTHTITLNVLDANGLTNSISTTITVIPTRTTNIAGQPATGATTWTSSNFPALTSETLNVASITGRTIGLDNLVYTTSGQAKLLKVVQNGNPTFAKL